MYITYFLIYRVYQIAIITVTMLYLRKLYCSIIRNIC